MKNPLFWTRFCALTAVALSACSAPTVSHLNGKSQAPLSGLTLVEEFPGHTLIGGIRNKAGAWATYVQPDGASLFRSPTGEILETQWAITGDRFCYADKGSVNKLCFHVRRQGQGYQFTDDRGKDTIYAVKRQEGDSLNLAGFLTSQRILRVRRAQQAIRNKSRASQVAQ